MTDASEITEYQAAQQPAAPSVLTFAKQLAAVDWLQAQGFKVKKSKFNSDVKAGRVATNADGHFEAPALLAYAAVHLQALARAEHSASVNASADKLNADARLKSIQAERHELKLRREQGLIMLKTEHESGLAARALFFKAELENFGLRMLPALIQMVGGREDSLQEALEWWAEHTAALMDAWSADREFVVADDDALPDGEELGEDTGGQE